MSLELDHNHSGYKVGGYYNIDSVIDALQSLKSNGAKYVFLGISFLPDDVDRSGFLDCYGLKAPTSGYIAGSSVKPERILGVDPEFEE